jgi:hypothetical protein
LSRGESNSHAFTEACRGGIFASPRRDDFSAILFRYDREVSKSDFGGTGVSDCVAASATPRLAYLEQVAPVDPG